MSTDCRLGGSSWTSRKQKNYQKIQCNTGRADLEAVESPTLDVLKIQQGLVAVSNYWLIVLLQAKDGIRHLQRSFPTNISMLWTSPGEVWQDKPHAGSLFSSVQNLRSDRSSGFSVLFCWKKKGGKKWQIFSFVKVQWHYVQKCLFPSELSRRNWIAVLKAETAFKTKYVIQSRIKREEREVRVEENVYLGNWFHFLFFFFIIFQFPH